MTLEHPWRRLTLVSLAAVMAGLVGCSVFKEQAAPKLSAEVTPGPAPDAPPTAKYFVEIRPDNGKPQAVEKALTEPIHVQMAIEQTGAAKKFARAEIVLFRPLPSGGWHKMELEYDRETHSVPPEYDYAVLPGDRIVVSEDTTTVFDDVMERALRPLGINPPKKKDPLREKYQIQG
jgi:hypothetical protein